MLYTRVLQVIGGRSLSPASRSGQPGERGEEVLVKVIANELTLYLLPGGHIGVPDRLTYLRVLLQGLFWLGVVPGAAQAAYRIGGPRSLTRLQRPWARGILRALRVRLTMEGLEHVDPAGRYIVVALHEGFADALALLQLPLGLRFVVRDELLGWRRLGRLLRMTRQIAICPEHGERGYRRLLREAEAALSGGESLVVFPQGTILGIETAFQPGAFRLARTLGRPILPIALTGSHRVWEHPYTPRLRFDQRMSLRVLPAVPAARVRTMPPEMLRMELQNRLKAQALDGRMALPRRFVPRRDGYWDGYAYEIDAAYPELAGEIAQYRSYLAGSRPVK